MSRDQTLRPYTLAQPEWCGDFLGREQLLPGGAKVDPNAFPLQAAQDVVIDGAVAAGAVLLTVDALTADLAPGTMLNFGIPGLMAFCPVGALAGAVTIECAPLDRALADEMSAHVDATIRSNCPSGTAVGRTFAERDAGASFGLAQDADDEIMLVAYDRANLALINDIDLVRPFAGVTVKENFLPNFDALSPAVKAALRARYICVVGRP